MTQLVLITFLRHPSLGRRQKTHQTSSFWEPAAGKCITHRFVDTRAHDQVGVPTGAPDERTPRLKIVPMFPTKPLPLI